MNVVGVTSATRITCYGDSEKSRQGSDGQDEAPAASKLPGAHPVQRVLVHGVLVATEAEAVEPGKEHVAVVAIDSGQGEQR